MRRKLRNLRACTYNLKNKRHNLPMIQIIGRAYVRWSMTFAIWKSKDEKEVTEVVQEEEKEIFARSKNKGSIKEKMMMMMIAFQHLANDG